MKDFYQILGVSKTATEQEIKKAYRKLAMEHHPDRNQSNQKAAEEKFKEISEAYSILSDPRKRQSYDTGGFNNAPQSNPFYGNPFGAQDFNFEELLNGFFRQRTGFGDSRGRTVVPGNDIKVETVITLEQVLNGTVEEFVFDREATCHTCDGSGAKKEADAVQACKACNGVGKSVTRIGTMHIAVPCGACAGTGKTIVKPCDACGRAGILHTKEKIKVSIPPGVQSGNILRIPGKGHDSPTKGGPSGNLYVVVHVMQHPTFERDEDDIYHEQKIPFTTAVLGGKVTIPVLQKNDMPNNTMDIVLNPGEMDEKLLQLENMGLPNVSTQKRGKQIIKFLIDVPALSKLTTVQRDLLRQFEETFK